MKLKLVSDGTPYRTYLVDEKGEKVSNRVTSISWSCGVEQFAALTVTIEEIEAIIEGNFTQGRLSRKR